MKKYQVFISYRRDGGEMLGQLLHDRLSQQGYNVFFDVEALRSGKFNDELYRVMDECTDIIVVLPREALARCNDAEDWVRKEISFCISKKKNIIPVMMRGFEFPESLPADINELRNYSGIKADEIASFPWVVEKLVTFLHSKPTKNNENYKPPEKKGSVLTSVFNCFTNIVAACLLALPYATQWLHLKFDWLPDAIEKVVNAYTNSNLGWVTLLLAVEFYIIYRFGIKNDYKYIEKQYKKKNIDEGLLNCTFEDFTRRLLAMDNMAVIVKNTEEASEQPGDFKTYKFFKGMEIGSINDTAVDYLYIDYSELPGATSMSILYLDKGTGKQRATNFLSKQGFVFVEEKEDILQFKKNNITIRLAYTEAGMAMLAFEMTRSGAKSRIRDKTYEAWNNSFVRETRLGMKAAGKAIKKWLKSLENKFLSLDKKKQGLIMGLALIFSVVICIVFIVLFAMRKIL